MRISRLFPLLSAMLLLTAPASKAGKTAQTGRSALACPTCCKTCCTPELSKLPREVFSGVRGPFHVQGIAVDLKNGYMYFSFTTELLKTDLQGKLIGSVKGMTGHLGCLTVNPEDGRVYGSLEYKNDEIGRGILRQLNKEGNGENPSDAFYVAIFDVDKITRPDMDAETDGVMTAVYLKEVVDDYYGTAVNGGREVKHRLGCSGIDGISFGPAFGAPKGSKPYLNVAYGIYGDTTRSDNDYQVILNYDPETWKPVSYTHLTHGQYLLRHPKPRLRLCVRKLVRRRIPGQKKPISELFALRDRRFESPPERDARRIRHPGRGRSAFIGAGR